jgi:hypothetical protein
MDAIPVTNKTAGEPESTYNSVLETGAGMTQVPHFTHTFISFNLISQELRTRQEDMRPPQRLSRLRARPQARSSRSKPLLRTSKRRSATMYSLRLSRAASTYHRNWYLHTLSPLSVFIRDMMLMRRQST